MKKLFSLAALAFTLLTGHNAQATTYEFSYNFLDGTAVTGKFDGTANGNLVTGLSNISVFVNSFAFAGNGNLTSGAFDRDTSNWSDNAVVSFNGLESNFGFADGDVGGANAGIFLIVPYETYSTDLAQAIAPGLYVSDVAGPELSIAAGWRLQAVPVTTPVPEPETYAMLLAGLGLISVVARRRKQG